MKKSKGLVGASGTAMMFIVLAFLGGCATTYYYEKDAPVETQAVLKWVGKEITTVALDEVGVKWKVKSFVFGSFGTSIVYLPPGPHTLTVNYKSNAGGTNAIHIGENFKSGHTYLLNVVPSGGLFSQSVRLQITEQPAR
jgi:hypothetical protein